MRHAPRNGGIRSFCFTFLRRIWDANLYKVARTSSKVSLDDAPPVFGDDDAERMLALDEALNRLAAFDERKCRVIEMRSFGGMSVEETARALGVSEPTVKRETRLAQKWLSKELELHR